MAYSYVTFTGDGADTTFSFAGIATMFPNTFLTYQSQLNVYVDGVLLTPTTDWSVTDVPNKIITFTTAPSNGSTIKIKRNTTKDSLLHTFASTAILTKDDLNNNNKQIFQIAQEIYDELDSSLGLTSAGDKWDGEGKPTYNFAPAVVGSGLTTLNQVQALLDGSLVGTFDEVDSFKFTGDGTTVNFDLTGVTLTGLTADAVLVQVNGVMQDPDVFSPSHSPIGSIGGGSPAVRSKKYTITPAVLQAGTISPATRSTYHLHELDSGEYVLGYYAKLNSQFTDGVTPGNPNVTLKIKSGVTTYDTISIVGLTTTTPQKLEPSSTPPADDGVGFVEIQVDTAANIAALNGGSMEITVLIASNTNNPSSTGTATSNANCYKYTLAYVSGTPRITFSTAPASGDVIIARVLSGTFQGHIDDDSITTNMLADGAVTVAKMSVGAGVDKRVIVFDTAGDGTARVLVSTDVSDFDTAVRASRLDQMAVPTADISVNSNKITNVAAGSASTDAINKSQLDAAVATAGVVMGRTGGYAVPANTLTPIAYPSGFSTYPKAVAVRLLSASSIAYGAASGHTSDTVMFYTDSGTTEARATSDIDHASGTHTGVWIEVTGTTSGINIRHNSSNFAYADIIWIK